MPRLIVCSLVLSAATIVSQPTPADAQVAPAQGRPAQAAPPRVASAAGGQQGQRPAVAQPQPISPALEATLQKWEQQSARVQKLTGVHHRYVFDTVAGIERRGGGKFWFSSPDLGRLDLAPMPISENDASKMKLPDGTPYKLSADQAMIWVTNGTEILQIEQASKGYYRSEIPPQLRGKNITESPLPFLFGMKAAELKARYRLQFGKNNTYNPSTDGSNQTVHIVAYPMRRGDATNWSQADVYLDGVYFLPHRIVLRDPYGTQMTMYDFPRSELRANKSEFFKLRDPFNPSLRGYKLLGEERATKNGASAR